MTGVGVSFFFLYQWGLVAIRSTPSLGPTPVLPLRLERLS
jgi:hypothetical protein